MYLTVPREKGLEITISNFLVSAVGLWAISWQGTVRFPHKYRAGTQTANNSFIPGAHFNNMDDP